MVNSNFKELLNDSKLRAEAYRSVNQSASELFDSIKTAITLPDDIFIDGWWIRRLYMPLMHLEMRLCESTKANITYTLDEQETEDIWLMVQRGCLHVVYEDGLGEVTARPGRPLFLPAGIKRTTFAAEHPTTIFALMWGRPEIRERDFSSVVSPTA